MELSEFLAGSLARERSRSNNRDDSGNEGEPQSEAWDKDIGGVKRSNYEVHHHHLEERSSN